MGNKDKLAMIKHITQDNLPIYRFRVHPPKQEFFFDRSVDRTT